MSKVFNNRYLVCIRNFVDCLEVSDNGTGVFVIGQWVCILLTKT